MKLEIDEEKCWGCRTCEAACKQENRAPDGVRLISLWEDGPRREEDRWHFVFRLNLCRHCEEPSCLDACAAGAIVKRNDGIVILDRDGCNGCRSCLEACPYGAVSFDEAAGVAAKCNLCRHRVDEGLLPACADNVCPARCIHFIREERNTDADRRILRPGP